MPVSSQLFVCVLSPPQILLVEELVQVLLPSQHLGLVASVDVVLLTCIAGGGRPSCPIEEGCEQGFMGCSGALSPAVRNGVPCGEQARRARAGRLVDDRLIESVLMP